jgi:hypothetical protein
MAIEDLKKNAADPISITIGSSDAPKPSVGPNAIKPKITKPEDIIKERKPITTASNKKSGKEDRVTIDLTNLAQPKPNANVEVRESPIKDILDENNPDSPFAKYLTRKEKEMDDYISELDHQQELAENDFIDEDGNNTANDGAVIGVESINNIDVTNEGSTDMSDYNVSVEDTSSLNIDITGGSKDTFDDEEIIEEAPVEEENVDSDDYSLDDIDIDGVEVDDSVSINTGEINMDEELDSIAEDTEENIMAEQPKVEEKKVVKKAASISDDELEIETDIIDADTSDLDVENEEDNQQVANDDDETLKELRKMATETLKPAAQSLDITSFTIAKKPSANLKLLNTESKVNAAKWVLPTQNAIVIMKEFLGAELEELRANSESSQSLMQLTRRYRMIYDHIVSNKAGSFEAWTKVTPFADADHYFFAAYIASFKGSNFMPMTCRNRECNKMSLSKDIPVLDMIKFDDDEAKAKFLELYKSTRENPRALYATEVIPLSDKVAISFKEASIYSLFEIASLDENFKVRYSSIIDYVPYIDSMYMIDAANHSLIPVGYKVYPDNAVKTTKSKITMFSKVLNTLSIDQFGPVKAYVADLITRRSKIGFKYILPEMSCPYCGSKIDELDTSAEELLFTRYQLGALMNTSIN